MKWKLEVTIESEGQPLEWGEEFWEKAINKGVEDPDDIWYDKVLSVKCIEMDGKKIEDENY
tara:strand:+ start:609 stop:791 length:183 start_codon:yes stop_codon:yes gene_type:complete